MRFSVGQRALFCSLLRGLLVIQCFARWRSGGQAGLFLALLLVLVRCDGRQWILIGHVGCFARAFMRGEGVKGKRQKYRGRVLLRDDEICEDIESGIFGLRLVVVE